MYESCIDGGYDAEPLEPCTVTIRKARKKHRCIECWELICPGEQYEHVKGCSDGSWFEAKTCMSCKRMRDSIFHTWTIGMVWYEFEETYGFDPFEVPTNEPKRTWGVL